MDIQGRKIFSESMRQDVSGQFAPPGSWIYSLNLIFQSTLSTTKDEVQTLLGNLKLGNAAVTLTGWECLAKHYDDNTGFLYYLLRKSSTDTHQVWRWSEATSHQLILNDPILNFLAVHEIRGITVVNGMLFWTEGIWISWLNGVGGRLQYSPPRCMNIDKVKRYTDSGGLDPLGYSSIDVQTLDAIKSPPAFAPFVEFSTDVSRKANFLVNKQLQFAYRYICDNGEYTLFSEFSRLVYSFNGETMDGKRIGDVASNNQISITINTGHQTATFIEIMVREGNSGAWGVFKKIDKEEEGLSNNVPYTLLYLGTEATLGVAAQDLLNYDYLPDVASHLRYLGNNTISYGDAVEGYPKPEFEANYTLLYNRIRKGPTSDAPFVESTEIYLVVFPFDFYGLAIQFNISMAQLAVGATIVLRGYQLLDVNVPDEFGNFFTFTYEVQVGDLVGATDADKLNNLISNMVTYLNAEYPAITFDAHTVLPGIGGPGILIQGFGAKYLQPLSYIINPIFKYAHFKEGCNHDVGVVYKQRANKDRGVASDMLGVFIPFPSITPPSGFAVDHAWFIQVAIDMAAGIIPPDWADTFCVAMRERTGIGTFMHRSVQYIMNTTTRTKIQLETYYLTRYVGASYNYDVEVGDTVVLKYIMVGGVSNIPSVHIEGTVMEIDSDGFVFIEKLDISAAGITAGAVFEIRKTKKVDTGFPYFGLSKEYPIHDAHTEDRKHGGETGVIPIERMVTVGSTIYVGDNKTFLEGRTIILSGTDNSDGPHLVTNAVLLTGSYQTSLSLSPALGAETEFPVGATLSFDLSQDGVLGATLILDRGDVIVRNRSMGMNNGGLSYNYWIESDSKSDYYDSKNYDKGRVYIYTPEASQLRRDNLIRNSLAYIGNTNPGQSYNQLNRFLPTNQREVKLTYGRITMMEERGYVLRVGQLRKMNAIPIERSITTNPGGTSDYVLTTVTLGPVDPSEYEWGPYRPEATLKVGADIYYWDVLNGVIVKDTTGGSYVINGDYNTFWQNKSRFLVQNESDDHQIRFGFDSTTRLLYISLTGADEENFTIVLDVLKDLWKGFIGISPSIYANADSRFFTFDLTMGQLWEHNVGLPLVFYDVALPWELQFYVNDSPDVNKVFLALSIAMSVLPMEVIVEAPPDSTYPLGQKTYVYPQREENVFTGAVMKNIFTEGKTNQAVALVDGSDMRNQFFKITIKGSAGQAALIKFLHLYYNIS